MAIANVQSFIVSKKSMLLHLLSNHEELNPFKSTLLDEKYNVNCNFMPRDRIGRGHGYLGRVLPAILWLRIANFWSDAADDGKDVEKRKLLDNKDYDQIVLQLFGSKGDMKQIEDAFYELWESHFTEEEQAKMKHTDDKQKDRNFRIHWSYVPEFHDKYRLKVNEITSLESSFLINEAELRNACILAHTKNIVDNLKRYSNCMVNQISNL